MDSVQLRRLLAVRAVRGVAVVVAVLDGVAVVVAVADAVGVAVAVLVLLLVGVAVGDSAGNAKGERNCVFAGAVATLVHVVAVTS